MTALHAVVILCDGACGTTYPRPSEFASGTAADHRRDLKAEGWTVGRGADWCPKCLPAALRLFHDRDHGRNVAAA